MTFICRQRLDGKYEIVIDGLVCYVHWDEIAARQWIFNRYPRTMIKEQRDQLLYRACGKV